MVGTAERAGNLMVNAANTIPLVIPRSNKDIRVVTMVDKELVS